MTDPIPNGPLLRQTLTWIRTYPSMWNQRAYRTVYDGGRATMDYAGWACTLAGGRWISTTDYLASVPADETEDLGVYCPIRARRVLGLTEEQANDLFHASNNLRLIEDIVIELRTQFAARAFTEDLAGALTDRIEPKGNQR